MTINCAKGVQGAAMAYKTIDNGRKSDLRHIARCFTNLDELSDTFGERRLDNPGVRVF